MKKTNDKLIKLEGYLKAGLKPNEIIGLLGVSLPTYYNWKNTLKTESTENKMFPDGLDAIMSYKEDFKNNTITLVPFSGKEKTIEYDSKNDFKSGINEFNNLILIHAHNFYKANKDNKSSITKDYIATYELYKTNNHGSISKMMQNYNTATIAYQIFGDRIYDYLLFNHFILLGYDEAKKLTDEVEKFFLSQSYDMDIINEVMDFKVNIKYNVIYIKKFDGTTVTEQYKAREQFEFRKRMLERAVLENARRFCEENKENDINMFYKEKFKIFTGEEHDNNMKLILENPKVFKIFKDSNSLNNYFDYMKFNQFLKLSFKEIQENERTFDEILEEYKGKDRDNIKKVAR